MKKSFYLIPAFALALASCSSDAPILEDETYDGPLQTNYLTVNISDTGIMQTRAGGDGEATDYEDGIGTENKVDEIRFYFFDKFKKSVKVSNATGTLLNYLDWNSNDEDGGPSTTNPSDEEKPNIEKIVTTKLVIRTPQGDRLPKYVVAVINPNADVKSLSFSDLDEFNASTAKFNATADGTFVMSNSVYLDNNEVMNAVDVEDYIKPDQTDATNNPAIIHVERANSKIRLSIADALTNSADNKQLSDGTVLYYTGVENTSGAENEKIYVKLHGWNVVSTPTKSYVTKNIEPTWTSTDLFYSDFWNWNSTLKKRSFWAINPSLNYGEDLPAYNNAVIDYYYGNYDDMIAVNGFKTPAEDSQDPLNYTYVMENAALSAANPATAHPSQLVIAAELVNENGETVEIAEWGTNHYTVSGLLTNLANYADIYQIVTTGEDGGETTTEYNKIGPEYFKFVAAEALPSIEGFNNADYTTEGRYQSYIQLDEDKVQAAGLKLTNSIDGQEMDPSALNELLAKNVLPAKIWTGGKTYFYFTIQHLGDVNEREETSPAYYGVVRNHIYDSEIITLKGLGTPVFEGNRVIIPEKPEKDEMYLAAKINVLSWRLVKKQISLEW